MSHAFTTLVSAEDLMALASSASPPLIFDAGFDLADTASGERAFAESHIAGSHHVHLDRDLSAAKTGRNGRHPLPEREAFAITAGRLGIAPGRQVVVLDRQGGIYAARLWWMLRWLGHPEVAVLDGGLAAWTAAGGAVAVDVTPIVPADPYPTMPSLAPLIEAAQLARQLGQGALLDARSGERFRGEKEPIDAVAGHIPGAINRFHAANMSGGRFKQAAQLKTEFETVLGTRAPGDLIHSCGSGVTACHNLLAMAHAGLEGSVLYAGSWSEWSSDPSRPVARG